MRDLNFTRGSVTDLWLFFCYDQMEKVIKTINEQAAGYFDEGNECSEHFLFSYSDRICRR